MEIKSIDNQNVYNLLYTNHTTMNCEQEQTQLNEIQKYYLKSILPDILTSEIPNFKYTLILNGTNNSITLEDYYTLVITYGKSIGIKAIDFVKTLYRYPKYLNYFLDDTNYPLYFKSIVEEMNKYERENIISYLYQDTFKNITNNNIYNIYSSEFESYNDENLNLVYNLNYLFRRLKNLEIIELDYDKLKISVYNNIKNTHKKIKTASSKTKKGELTYNKLEKIAIEHIDVFMKIIY